MKKILLLLFYVHLMLDAQYSKKVFDQNEILGIFHEGDTLSNKLLSAKAGAVFLSTLGQVPIVPMSIYGMKKGLWDYILSGIKPNITLIK